ncbi:protein MIZU-KUSSEI 1-like isoform X2 [Rhodamnia argentea]|uniref:Protein MIZU-KUSSEI 1-like isoform X2 n=1 Tax=Rhodamnia argentea TaxID=178133 RepID=A0ABM3HJJ7_9MYRT|nr:protein MIZU-KUSSEI 1-like isoform X2 [Rhodamnia argentea]
MKTILSGSPHESSSFSFSRRYFNWRKKLTNDDEDQTLNFKFSSSSHHFFDEDEDDEDKDPIHDEPDYPVPNSLAPFQAPPKKLPKLRAALHLFGKKRSKFHAMRRTHVVGTLFGNRRGHVHFAFQDDTSSAPAFLIQLAVPTSVLVREMASGVVRIALECDKKATTVVEAAKKEKKKNNGGKLAEEAVWRTYCNGRKCGYALQRECGEEEEKVLSALEVVSMGAGVLPGDKGDAPGEEGEMMYMRARFERVVGSGDSEAFYMMSPDGSGGPELSLYLLRV